MAEQRQRIESSRLPQSLVEKQKFRLAIQLSGFSKQEKKVLQTSIEILGGRYYSSPSFDERCNLVVLKQPCRSEKYLCGLAIGIPIVTELYITDSLAAHQWLNAEKYIWCPNQTNEEYPADLLRAPLRAITKRRDTGEKAFKRWTCSVLVKERASAVLYERILSAGGARVVSINTEKVTSSRTILSGMTHLFTEIFYRGPVLNTIAKQGVHCIIADYIGDFLIREEKPQAHHYIVPYCPIIDLSNSLTDSDSSPAFVFEEKSIIDLDSDVEIISPTKSASGQLLPRRTLPMPSKGLPQQEASKARNNLSEGLNLLPCSEERFSGNEAHRARKKSKISCTHQEAPSDAPILILVRPLSPQQAASIKHFTQKNLKSQPGTCCLSPLNTPPSSNTNLTDSEGTVSRLSPEQQHSVTSQPTEIRSDVSGSHIEMSPAQKKYTKLLVLTPNKQSPCHSSSSILDKSLTPPHTSTSTPKCKTSEGVFKSRTLTSSGSLSAKQRNKSNAQVSQPECLNRVFEYQNLFSDSSITISPLKREKTTEKSSSMDKKKPTNDLLHLEQVNVLKQREDLYDYLEKVAEFNQSKTRKALTSTADLHSQVLCCLPVIFMKQIETFMDSKYDSGILSGMNMIEICTSSNHYLPAHLFKPLYSLLLRPTDATTALTVHHCLINQLLVTPPSRRVHQDEISTSSGPKYMRQVYMSSLAERPFFKQSYLTYLSTAVTSIVKGNVWANGSGDAGPSEGALSTLCDSEEEDEGAGVTPPSTDDELYQSKATGEGEDCCRGSRLFISFMAKLLKEDFLTVEDTTHSMLYSICKGNSFGVNLVDSADSKSLFQLTELLFTNQEIELGLKLLELAGFLAEMCKPVGGSNTISYPLAQVLTRVSNIVMKCATSTAENILTGVYLPKWFSYQLIISILENPLHYNSQLISSNIPSSPFSLQALISNSLFLVPNEGNISAIDSSSETSSSALPPVKSKRNYKGETSLHVACIKGDTAKVRQLLKDSNTDVNAADNAGWTPLHEACNHQKLDIVEILLTHRSPHFHADGRGQVNLLTAAGDDLYTPLHDAVNVGAVEVVRLLLKHGGKKLVTAPSKQGTPLDIATNPEIIQLLQAALVSSSSSSDCVVSNKLKIMYPNPQVYCDRTCSISKPAVERYIMYCTAAVNLYVDVFQLNSNDRYILNHLDDHIQPFLQHIKWLNSDSHLQEMVTDTLDCLLLLSL